MNDYNEMADSAEGWPMPISLEGVVPSVKSFTPEMLPEPFRDWLTDLAYRMQCPLDYLAATTMVVTSSVVGTGCVICPKQLDNWVVVPNLYGVLVGPPSMMKTPAMKPSMKMLAWLEKQAGGHHQQAMKQFQAEEEAYKMALEQCKKLNGKELLPEEVKQKVLSLQKPVEPVQKRYQTTDATIEKLIELLAQNPRGILIFWDELAGLLANWEKPGHETDRAFYLEAWNGNGSFRVERISRGSIAAEVCCLSVMGSIQPDRLRDYLLKTTRGGNDGMIQRFQLSVYPTRSGQFKYVDQEPDLEAEKRAQMIILRLAEMDFLKYGAGQDESSRFPYFRFNEEAQAFFKEWLLNLENEKLPKEQVPLMIEHLTKYRSLLPSLALLFHLIEVADGRAQGPVPLRCVKLAATWCDVLESHARRIYALIGKPEESIISIIIQKIMEGDLQEGFSVRNAYRSNAFLARKTQETKAALDRLEAAHWIRKNPVALVKLQGGQPPSPTYQINPNIFC